MLHTSDLAVEPDDRLRQGEHASRPEPAEFHHDPARRQQQGERRDPEQRRDAEKGDVEQERPQPAHRSWLKMARPSPVLRTTGRGGAGGNQGFSNGRTQAARYLSYSPRTKSGAPCQFHHSSGST